MQKLLLVILLCSAFVTASSQNAGSKYEPGTIVAVTPHQNAPVDNSDTIRYDVSVKVRDKVYVALYTPPNGLTTVEYATGTELLVLVGKDILTFNSRLSGTTQVPILRTEALAKQPTLDLSKAPGHYFTMKMQNLTEVLHLSEEQQAQIKPIAEQESSEVGALCFTPVVPRKERLRQWKRIVRSSDAKLKPILSQSQWAKLQDLRKEQKQELNNRIAQDRNTKNN